MSGELLRNDNIMTEGENLCPACYVEKKDGVSYGRLEHISYYSATTGCERPANVLFPANYRDGEKYPVIFFLHGIFGDEYSMINDPNNKLDAIIGNMVNEGLVKDSFVIFPHMYATGDPNLKPGFTSEQVVPYDNFINDLVNDLIPYVEKTYPVLSGRDNRGIIGFSMGGRESLFIGVTRSDLFSYIGGIAPAPGLAPAKDWAMSHLGQLSREDLRIHHTEAIPKLLLICCGTVDKVVSGFPNEYHQIMTKNGCEHTWYEVPNADHDSNAIRSGFYNFLLRAFKY